MPAGVFGLLVRVMAPLEAPLCCATLETVPEGNPPTLKLTAPELPLTVAVILAGVPSCGARAMDEESERLRVPGPPELPPLLHPAIARPVAPNHKNKIP